MHLIPQRNFTVVRQIADHTDVTTYYVRAVIRNAYTDVILTTLNLEDKTGQRFKKDWQVPADPSGEGFFVSIVTSVYTDSGYTTKSSDYGDEENSYLVINTPSGNHTGGGVGMGGGLARRDVRDIIQEELEKFLEKLEEIKPEPIDIPKYEMRWDDILGAVKSLGAKVDKIKVEKPDLEPVIKAISDVKTDIKNIKAPEVDLKPLVDKLEEYNIDSKDNADTDKAEMKDIVETAMKGFTKKSEEILKDVLERVEIIPFAKLKIPEKDKIEEEKPININDLS
jgi:hypothetical protein